jgi:hypothetical protein
VVPISPVDGLWRCNFAGPEGASAAVEIVEDSSILSETFIAHVHSSGFQSLILGTWLGVPAGPILSVRVVCSGSHGVSQGFYGSIGYGQGVSMG